MLHEHKDRGVSCWQTDFIQTNLPVMGYFAWQGYTQVGRGLVVCECDRPVFELHLNPMAIVPFTTRFIPASETVEYLLKAKLQPDEISPVQAAIHHYDAHRELIVLLTPHQQPEILRLQNLAITPPACYEQVLRRWEEFIITQVSNDHDRF